MGSFVKLQANYGKEIKSGKVILYYIVDPEGGSSFIAPGVRHSFVTVNPSAARNRVPPRRDELTEGNLIHTAQIYLNFYTGLNYHIV
jgi:hypothetical protein